MTTTSPLRLPELQKESRALGLVVRELLAAGCEAIHCARRIGDGTSPAATDFLKLVLDDAESFVRRPLHRLKKRNAG